MTKNIKNQKAEESAEESTVTAMTNETTETWGTVCNCKKLNVRERPTKKAKVLRILDSDEVVLIDTLEARMKGWYKVTVEDGIVGYCMEDFIKIS